MDDDEADDEREEEVTSSEDDFEQISEADLMGIEKEVEEVKAAGDGATSVCPDEKDPESEVNKEEPNELSS